MSVPSVVVSSSGTCTIVIDCLIDEPASESQCLLFPSRPNQPKLSKEKLYGKQKRFFLSGMLNIAKMVQRETFSFWYVKYQCLHYQEHDDSGLCYYCLTAENQGLLKCGNEDDAFTKIRSRFEKHQNSESHHEAVENNILVTIPSSSKDVGEMLS